MTLKLFVQLTIMRLLPTFFTENFGSVSCARRHAQAERMMMMMRDRTCFFMLLKRKKDWILLSVGQR
jgi:hypothetical protein